MRELFDEVAGHSPLDPEDALANDGELVRNALRGALPRVQLRLAA